MTATPQRHEDAIDFPCAPVWVRHYAAHGLTQDYPLDLTPRSTGPESLPLPDPLRTLQQYNRFHHLDLPRDAAVMERELRQITPFEMSHWWFAERIEHLQQALVHGPVPLLPPDERVKPPMKGIEV